MNPSPVCEYLGGHLVSGLVVGAPPLPITLCSFGLLSA